MEQLIALAIVLCLAAFIFSRYVKFISRREKSRSDARIQFILSFHNQIQITTANFMARINNLQTISVELKPLNRKGGAAQVQAGSVQWSSSDESVATISVDPENELKATVTAVGLGVAQIMVSADADLDEGETRTIEGSGAIEVVAAEAETFEVTFGEPVDAE